MQLGMIGLSERDKAIIYQPAQHVADYLGAIEIVDFGAEGASDRFVLTVRAFGDQLKKFVFAGARQHDKPVPFAEADLRTVFFGGPMAQCLTTAA